MKTNYHTHTNYSDGITAVEEMVNCAIGNDFDIIGISDHSPVPFPSAWNMKYEKIHKYLNDIEQAKNIAKDKTTVLKGMEVDFFPDLNNIAYFKSFGLDYTIGSVHYLKTFPNGRAFNVDKSKDEFINGLKQIFGNDIKKLSETYYSYVIEMVKNDPPDIIAHLTLIEKFNKQLKIIDTSAQWYRQLVFETLKVISQSDCILEINARSWYKGLSDEFVPPLWAVKFAHDLNIPITINGDIHQPQEYGMFWDDAVNFVKAANYDHITIILDNQKRQNIKI